MYQNKLFVCTLAFSLFCSLFIKQSVAGEKKNADYKETISVLQNLYKSEVVAYKTYSRFAQKADAEKHYSVARLFRALSESESIHARNFKTILNELGVEPKRFPEPDVRISKTKKNLKWALKVELAEIDTHYPKLIQRIKSEKNEEALKYITYAWKSEMQHRDMIKKMQGGLRFFYGMIVDKLKEAKKYHVCQCCGATVFTLPEKCCVICGSQVSMYKQVK